MKHLQFAILVITMACTDAQGPRIMNHREKNENTFLCKVCKNIIDSFSQTMPLGNMQAIEIDEKYVDALCKSISSIYAFECYLKLMKIKKTLTERLSRNQVDIYLFCQITFIRTEDSPLFSWHARYVFKCNGKTGLI